MIRIDFVSDIVCPWCAVGLASLTRAVEALGEAVPVEIHLHPFELNPDMPPEGKDASDYIMRKYGMTVAQRDASRAVIRERAAAVGFVYNIGAGSRVWNTFDGHRLIHAAGLTNLQQALTLKRALLKAYFTDNENVSDAAVLRRVAMSCGMEAAMVDEVLHSDRYAAEVREQERASHAAGIQSVPATIINGRHLISGGQPPEAFEQALREIAVAST